MPKAARELDFFDCNVWFGLPMNRPAGAHKPPPADAAELLAEMDRAGIREALVWHAMQRDIGPVGGNPVLAEAVHGAKRLHGCWAILPPHTRELGTAEEFFRAAKKAGIRAFRAFPDMHRFLLRREAVGQLMERLVAMRAPLVLRVGDVGWEGIYNLMAAYPELTLILANMGVWNNDRQFRPLIELYPNVHIETSGQITDGGIEAFVASYGPDRLLFGSGFPESYFGSLMLAIAHAEIPLAAKRAIAGGNLRRLLDGVRPA